MNYGKYKFEQAKKEKESRKNQKAVELKEISEKTKVEYTMDLGRMSDKFLSSDKVNYSFDDIIKLMEDGNTMLIFIKNTK